MKLFDVNILVQAFRTDSPDHQLFRKVLEDSVNGPSLFGLSRVAISGFLRIVSNTRVFKTPTPIDLALAFIDEIISRPQFRFIDPGPSHWTIFRALCSTMKAEGNLIPDIWFAALAIESGSTWISGDRDYGLVPSLDWKFIHR